MKKLLSLLLILTLIFSLTGCKSKVEKDQNNMLIQQEIGTGEILTISDYFPFKENIVMEYEGRGNEYAEQITFIEFVENNRAQMKIMNPGTVIVKVLEYSNGALSEMFFEGEFYHIENMLNANSNTNNTILKEPLEVGNTWSNKEGYPMEITSLNEEIKTPAGNYTTLEVTTKYEEGKTLKEYYAKDIGLVAKVYNDGDFKVETLLKDIEKEKQELDIMSFYAMKKEIGSAYVIQEREFGTNDNIIEILEDILKNPPQEELIPCIPQETKINGVDLDRETWTLKVDFSKELMSNMNTGSALELEMLQSLVNTLGRFYDVDKVYISIEGVAYESGHFGIKSGEYFTVDIENIKEFQ